MESHRDQIRKFRYGIYLAQKDIDHLDIGAGATHLEDDSDNESTREHDASPTTRPRRLITSHTETFTQDIRRAFEDVICYVVIKGGDPAKRFRRVPIVQTKLSNVTNVAELQHYVSDIDQIRHPLKDVYGLNLHDDLLETTLTFTDHNRHRVAIALDDFREAISGEVATWKQKIVQGELEGATRCDCGTPCTGTIHTPEIHMVLRLERVMGKAADHYQIRLADRNAIPMLEARVAELEKENGELRSELLGLQLVKEDLEESGQGRRKLRRRT